MFENSTVNINALCNSCEDMACCSSECVLTFLYAGDNIRYVNEQFVSGQTDLSRKPFGIGHMFILTFLLRITDTMNSQNIGLYIKRYQLLKEQMIGEYNEILKIIINRFETSTHSLCINKMIISLVASNGRSRVSYYVTYNENRTSLLYWILVISVFKCDNTCLWKV